ncbi:MAG TPA: LysR family transcriptional regulator [Candidatus Blautia merdavium]|uniref:LysR family transcriptional regulator n=1 Tax=Candidatus Blautia merdavium TaxID=2838494 RepID=A0A9D2PPF8_9FIRM|nr:LysR family transcriptional regulator [Candidatus Blautia merdavium]
MDISFELYKVFYYVATTLSFSEASRQLFISQSAVSQSVKSLEQKLGHPLFVRSTKKVSLTPEGESLLHHVEPAVNLLYEGENQIRNSPSLKAPLRIGASDTICRYFLVPYFKRFHREFPDIRIRVINATSGGCVSLLRNNLVDFIVANYPNPELTQKDSFFVIREFQDIFVAGKKYFNLEEQVLSLSQLTSYPILMLEKDSATSQFLHQLFTKHGLSLSPEAELSSNDLLLDLAQIGLGITVVPDYVLKRRSKDFYSLNIRENIPKRQLALACSPQISSSAAAQNFLRYFLPLEDLSPAAEPKKPS